MNHEVQFSAQFYYSVNRKTILEISALLLFVFVLYLKRSQISTTPIPLQQSIFIEQQNYRNCAEIPIQFL